MAGRSIPRHIPPNHVSGDFPTLCDYCGAAYLRSELVRDGAGLLVCPGEGEGLDATTLSQMQAENTPVLYEYEGTDGQLDPRSTDTAPVVPFLVGPPWR